MKICVVGAGRVGSASAFCIAVLVRCDDLRLVDVVKGKAIGEAMDIETAACVLGKKVRIMGGGYELMNECDIVVVAAGMPRSAGMSRLDLAEANVSIIRKVVGEMNERCRDAILIVVTNPVDVLVYHATKLSGRPREKIFGIGSSHDTARLVKRVGEGVMVIGEHGDGMVPISSGRRVRNLSRMMQEVREEGAKIIDLKGGSWYAPAVCVADAVKAIVEDERREIPVSVMLHGEYGLSDVAMGVPAIIGREGIIRIVERDVSKRTLQELHRTAKILKNVILKIESHGKKESGEEVV